MSRTTIKIMYSERAFRWFAYHEGEAINCSSTGELRTYNGRAGLVDLLSIALKSLAKIGRLSQLDIYNKNGTLQSTRYYGKSPGERKG